jgi:hypothetical protein
MLYNEPAGDQNGKKSKDGANTDPDLVEGVFVSEKVWSLIDCGRLEMSCFK